MLRVAQASLIILLDCEMNSGSLQLQSAILMVNLCLAKFSDIACALCWMLASTSSSYFTPVILLGYRLLPIILLFDHSRFYLVREGIKQVLDSKLWD